MMPFGSGLATGLSIEDQIGASGAEVAWIAASYPMSQGAFVLIGGRFGDVYGHKNVLLAGATWWVVWSLVTGFCHSVVTVSLFRGLTGIGAAFITPNAVALLAHTFPPGRLRNIAMGLFGAMAPLGAAGGGAIAALLVQLTPWKWMFFFFAILGFSVFSLVFWMVPNAPPSDKGGTIDWVGAYLGVGGLILFNFVWNQAPIVGWQNPYEYILLLISILHFCAFAIWEARIAQSPILPFDIWTAPSVLPLIIVVFLSFMSFGVVSWYTFEWNINIRGYSILSAAAAVQPLTVGGAFAAFTASWLIPRLSAQYILAIGAGAVGISNLLLATMPAQQIYWQTEFWVVATVAFSPDFIFTASQIVASNSVSRDKQGIAGSLVGTLMTYGMSTGLGFGGTVEAYTNHDGTHLLRGYRNALYLGIGFAGLSLVLSLLFIRIKKDEREGWADTVETPEVVERAPGSAV
ncbi:Major facilitator superfamily domain, general substrate transporter [Penicillium occitanis (nom. inval.)]|nr:Major facilitator superfamily domain, general substrate transporter [Penicillium occitanis (nom. inval.)]PCG92019.1 hypothetical protein PENOC_094640 [Penicillium occitanis (nom. inval.)]